MKLDSIIGMGLGIGLVLACLADDDKPAAATTEVERARPSSAAKPAVAPKPQASQEELEAKFKATMTKATLSGRWCGLKDGQLTPEKEDKYTIIGVAKVKGDSWIINARIQYGKQDFVLPVPVEVKWAGDTPVITVDTFGMPGGNSYSARVLIYGQTYAGSWSGGNHAGLMSGVITHDPESK